MASARRSPAPAPPSKRASGRTPPTRPTHIGELTSDPHNRRAHTPRNVGMITDALHRVGAARSIVIDEDNVILAGNATVDAAAEAGITKLRVIEADGAEVIAVRRSGLTDAQKRYLAIADNRAAELAQWDVEQLARDHAAGLDLEAFWRPEELEQLLVSTMPPDVPTPEQPTGGGGTSTEQYGVLVVCGSEEEQERVYRELTAQGRTCKVVTTTQKDTPS